MIETLSYLDTLSTPIDTVSAGPFSVFQTIPYVHNTSLCSLLPPSTLEVDARLADEAQLEDSSNATWNTMNADAQVPSLQSLSPRIALYSSLFHDPDTSMLLHHYANHVAELLQPVRHPGNPWRTTYFQFALDGRQEHGPSSAASTAIFHSVLSSAAFHLRNATRSSKKFHNLGLKHRAKSLHALNAALSHPSNSRGHTLYMTAMLSLVTIDVSFIPLILAATD